MTLVPDVGLESAVDMLLRHQFVRRIDEHAEFADSQLGGSTRIQLRDDEGNLIFPRIQRLSIEPATLTAEQDAARAASIYGERQTLLASLRKLVWCVEAMSTLAITDWGSFIGIEYHAENYYLRMPAVHEQVLRLVALSMKVAGAETLSRRRLQEDINRLSPGMCTPLARLASNLALVRRRRNEVAHGVEFEDGRLAAARSWITANLDSNFRSERGDEVSVLTEWRAEMLVQMRAGILSLVEEIASLFDVLLPIARPTMPSWRDRGRAT